MWKLLWKVCMHTLYISCKPNYYLLWSDQCWEMCSQILTEKKKIVLFGLDCSFQTGFVSVYASPHRRWFSGSWSHQSGHQLCPPNQLSPDTRSQRPAGHKVLHFSSSQLQPWITCMSSLGIEHQNPPHAPQKTCINISKATSCRSPVCNFDFLLLSVGRPLKTDLL